MALAYGTLAIIFSLLTNTADLSDARTVQAIINILQQILSIELLGIIILLEFSRTAVYSIADGAIFGVGNFIAKFAILLFCLYVSSVNVNTNALDMDSSAIKLSSDFSTTSIYNEKGLKSFFDKKDK